MIYWVPSTHDSFGQGHPVSPHREIDFEFSRWGNPFASANAQGVVQPWATPGNLFPYTIPDLSSNAELTHLFTWSPPAIVFTALRGTHSPPWNVQPADLIENAVYLEDPSLGHFVPRNGKETFRFNLWLNNGAPANGTSAHVLVTHFSFLPG